MLERKQRYPLDVVKVNTFIAFFIYHHYEV